MIRVERQNAEAFDISRLLQKGVYIEKPDTVSVSGFISELLGIDPAAIGAKVGTVMLDNKVVDDPATAPLDGETLVLSGAMPGLVGAMLRSGSPYGAMRSKITSDTRRSPGAAGSGLIRVKALNTILRDYRQRIVDRGFWIEPEDAGDG